MDTVIRIAVVDDERPITEPIAFSLRKAGYEAEIFHDGARALASFRERPPQLIVLDIMMPQMDGLELCRRLRGENLTIPIIFLSSRDEELDRLLGFEMGGDDYLTKPFSMRELLARVKALLRRAGGTAPLEKTVSVGEIEIDVDSALCRMGNRSVPLTLTELRILTSLAAEPGVVRSRRQLMTAAFPEDIYANERAADSHIKRLRRKLADLGKAGERIETIYGMGYRIKPDGDRR